MRLSCVRIENYRNFKNCEVQLGQNIVLVGENKSGKSNFIEALRLILDPDLSEKDRQLTEHDFWNGNGEKSFDGREIKITIQFMDFAEDDSVELLFLASLCDYFIQTKPEKIAEISYRYYPKVTDKTEFNQDDYKFEFYGGQNKRVENIHGLRKSMPLTFIEAIRDLAGDSKSWRGSPLKRLIELIDDLNHSKFDVYASEIQKIIERVTTELTGLGDLTKEVGEELEKMIGALHTIEPRLGINATTGQTLLEALRLFVDGSNKRSIDQTSLGLQNALYLSLLSLQLEKKMVRRGNKQESYRPIIALEEPEAHLHPHLQRLVFKHFLKKAGERKQPVIISTHSPYLVSVSEIQDIVLLRDTGKTGSRAESAYNFLKKLNQREQKDLQRFLDITKAEMLFAKGVIFVEGDVEMLLVPLFATIMGKSLDEQGVSICNVYGTNFSHVVILAHELKIPFVVFTDGDKYQEVKGLKRSIELVEKLAGNKNLPLQQLYETQGKENEVRKELQEWGFFVNEWTLEPTLIEAGLHDEIKKTFSELGEELGQKVKAGASYVDEYLKSQQDENMKQILKAIDDTRWGKGRFAHRLANHIQNRVETLSTHQEKIKIIPEYIRIGIDCLVKQIQNIKLSNEND